MPANRRPCAPRVCKARLRRSQQGLVLAVGLIVLAVMMMVGLAAVRQVAQGVRLATHGADRSLAFQAADSALREIEQRLEQVKPEPLTGPCSDFVNGPVSVRTCPAPTAQALPRWLDPAFTAWDTASPTSPAGVTPTSPAPSYFAEFLGNGYPCGPSPSAAPNCRRYRITARAGDAGRAQAMVQAIYATD